MYLPYVIHELCNRSHRTLINIMGIALGIGLFVAINAVATGFHDAVSLPFKNLGADIVVQRPEKDDGKKNALCEAYEFLFRISYWKSMTKPDWQNWSRLVQPPLLCYCGNFYLEALNL